MYYVIFQGFSVNFKSEILSSDLGFNPIKVEYDEVDCIKKIALIFDEFKNKDLFPKIVRWATLKKQEWYHENEWRYLFFDIDLGQTNRLRKFS